jgi:hypothetical protein
LLSLVRCCNSALFGRLLWQLRRRNNNLRRSRRVRLSHNNAFLREAARLASLWIEPVRLASFRIAPARWCCYGLGGRPVGRSQGHRHRARGSRLHELRGRLRGGSDALRETGIARSRLIIERSAVSAVSECQHQQQDQKDDHDARSPADAYGFLRLGMEIDSAWRRFLYSISGCCFERLVVEFIVCVHG